MLVACGDRSPAPTASSNSVPTLERPADGTTNYPSGALREEYQYFIEQGESGWHGAYRTFYEDGTVQTQGFFSLGQRDSTWAFFDSTGFGFECTAFWVASFEAKPELS